MSEEAIDTASGAEPSADTATATADNVQTNEPQNTASAEPPAYDGNWNLNPDDYQGVTPEFVGGYADIAKELQIDGKVAGNLLTKAFGLIQSQEQAVVERQAEQWKQEARNDPEFGGMNFETNLAMCNQAIKTWGNDKFVSLLKETGMANHPEMVRFLYRASKAVSEDTFARGGTGTGQHMTTFDDVAVKFYPSMNKQK